MMIRKQLFDQPSFIPIYQNWTVFEGKNIGITGARGTLGKILNDRMIANNTNLSQYPGDITDSRALESWFREKHFDYFFHFAAVVPINTVSKQPLNSFETNAIGTYNICKSILDSQRVCWLFIASSSHVYKPNKPNDNQPLELLLPNQTEAFYGISKLASEQISRPLLNHFEADYCIGRIFSFSGINQKGTFLVPNLIQMIEQLPTDGTLKVINPDSVRDIIDAETVIDCILHLAEKRFNGTIDIGSGQGMRIKEIAKHLAKNLGKKIEIDGINEKQPNSLVADASELKAIVAPKA